MAGECELCAAGTFCASSTGTGAARRLLTQAQLCGTGTTSGPGAKACVADCGPGMYSPDGTSAGCRSTSGPLLLRTAYSRLGQTAVAAVQLDAPWDALFVVARVSAWGGGQLVVVEVLTSLPKSYFPQSHSCPPLSATFANGAPRLGYP